MDLAKKSPDLYRSHLGSEHWVFYSSSFLKKWFYTITAECPAVGIFNDDLVLVKSVLKVIIDFCLLFRSLLAELHTCSRTNSYRDENHRFLKKDHFAYLIRVFFFVEGAV